MQKEIWKDVLGYEGLYQVSSLGRVKSLKFNKEKILKLRVNKKRYFEVVLYIKGKSKVFKVHRLIAMSFLNYKNNQNKLVIDHINNNQLDNNIDNLQIITQRENTNKDKKGTSKYTGVSWNKLNNKWISKIYLNGKQRYLGSFDSELEAYNAYQYELITNK